MTLSYNTAKWLKEMGFPQVGEWYFIHVAGTGNPNVDYEVTHAPYFSDRIVCICPTLSELIEACGGGFISLNKLAHPKPGQDRWIVVGKSTKTTQVRVTGPTHSEAVAELWLAIKTNESTAQ